MSVINTPGGISTVVVAPANIELAVPFHVDGSGGIAVVTDRLQIAIQHLLTIAFTIPGERVMHPTYGVGLQGMVFTGSPIASFSAAAVALNASYVQSDGGAVVTSVTVQQTANNTFVFSVNFTIDQDPVVHQAVFDYAGNLVGST